MAGPFTTAAHPPFLPLFPHLLPKMIRMGHWPDLGRRVKLELTRRPGAAAAAAATSRGGNAGGRNRLDAGGWPGASLLPARAPSPFPSPSPLACYPNNSHRPSASPGAQGQRQDGSGRKQPVGIDPPDRGSSSSGNQPWAERWWGGTGLTPASGPSRRKRSPANRPPLPSFPSLTIPQFPHRLLARVRAWPPADSFLMATNPRRWSAFGAGVPDAGRWRRCSPCLPQ